MSDGPSDAARDAESAANQFIKKHYPNLKVIETPLSAPRQGKVVLVYEEWLRHIIELVSDRQVMERWIVESYSKTVNQVEIGKNDWPVGYYRNNQVPCHRKEYWRPTLKVIKRRRVS